MPSEDRDEIELGSVSGEPRGPSRPRVTPRPLERLFGNPVPLPEMAMWSLMDADQRTRALQRANALVRYANGDAGVPARVAAADAGVTLVRFHQMNARWRDGPSLAALGVGARPERRRRSQFSPDVNAVLQSIVADIVRDDDASVRSLAIRLADIARAQGVPESEVPGHNTLRDVVQRARRDRRRRREVGNGLLLDHAACGIMRDDGAPWTIFVVVDAASQLILGAAPGGASAVDRGYADAARDAGRRICDAGFAEIVWADHLTHVQLVPGNDGDAAFNRVVAEARAIGVGINLTADNKAGRYLERAVGLSIGVMPIWPWRVDATDIPGWAAERAPVLDLERARARIILAVEDYNTDLLQKMSLGGDGVPPAELERLLEALAN